MKEKRKPLNQKRQKHDFGKLVTFNLYLYIIELKSDYYDRNRS